MFPSLNNSRKLDILLAHVSKNCIQWSAFNGSAISSHALRSVCFLQKMIGVQGDGELPSCHYSCRDTTFLAGLGCFATDYTSHTTGTGRRGVHALLATRAKAARGMAWLAAAEVEWRMTTRARTLLQNCSVGALLFSPLLFSEWVLQCPLLLLMT
ncbi:hypothetical protein BS78_02G020400 [Paspalum vaginatum]|nr:hypothetical protein BS78_02G020400 [Paspalum vaginatum]